MDRRHFLFGSAIAACSTGFAATEPETGILTKTIPSSGALIPALGMGSWLTFDVGADSAARNIRREVLRAFFEADGRLIDSSPMYGTSQETIGWCLGALAKPDRVIAADKVWTPQHDDGPAQIERSRVRWGVSRFDLLQVHNLVDWRRHLETLFDMKAQGRVRYVGVTS
jgi:diketogulonate reductase-like aldo/keto reductase